MKTDFQLWCTMGDKPAIAKVIGAPKTGTIVSIGEPIVVDQSVYDAYIEKVRSTPSYPQYYLVEGKPVKVDDTELIPYPHCLVYDEETGLFELDLDYLRLIYFEIGDVCRVDEETFNANLKLLRNRGIES